MTSKHAPRIILPTGRSRLLAACLLLGLMGLAGRAAYLQGMHNGFLQQKGESRYSRVLEMSAHRGIITDRHGEPLAISTPVESVWSSPQDMNATPEQLKKLAGLIEMDTEEIRKRLNEPHHGPRRDFVYLKRHLSPEVAARVVELNLPGVFLKREYRRYYPAGELTAHMLGFTDIDDKGQEGIELAWQEELAGKPGSRRVIKDRKGRVVEDVESIRAPRSGQNIALSIDSKIQYLAFRELKQAVEANKAKASEKDNFAYAEVDCNAPKVEKYFYLDRIEDRNGLNLTLKLNRDITNCPNQTNVSATVKIYHPTYGLLHQFTTTLNTGSDEIVVNKMSNLSGDAGGDLISLSYTDRNRIVVEVVGGKATLTLWRNKDIAPSEIMVGGLRIKTVIFGKSINDVNPTIRNYSYTESTTSTATSGVLLNDLPVYGFRFKNMVDNTFSMSGTYNIVQNTSVIPLSDFEGYHIRYKRVVVSETGKGASEYLYDVETSPNDKSFPALTTQYIKNNGKLKKQTQYSATNDMVSESTYIPTDESRESLIRGNFVRMLKYSTHAPSSSFPVAPQCVTSGSFSITLGVMYQHYRIKTSVYRLKEQIDIRDGVSTSTKFDYYSNSSTKPLYPISIRMTNSNGLETETLNRYVQEYTDGGDILDGQTAGVMIDKNIIATPIQTIKKVNGKVVEGSRIKFGLFKTSTGNPFVMADGNPYLVASVYLNKVYAYKPLTTTFENNWELEATFLKYDNITGKAKEYLPKGWWITNTFDWYRNGMLKERNVGALKWKYEIYDNSNLLKSVTDENNFKTVFDYDGLMRLKETKSYFADGSLRATKVNTYNYRPANVPLADVNKKEFNNYVNSKITFEGIGDPLSTTEYLDGLGRPFEVVREFYTPAKKHQKSYMTYAIFGRTDKSYQPFESTTVDVEAASNETPFTYPEYEASPLSRPTKQYMEDGKFVKMEYGTNTSAEVRKFSISPTVQAAGSYDAGLLYKTTYINENGKRTIVFRDKLGRTLLTRKFLGNDEVDTYNIYDDYDNLIMTIPPGAIVSNNIQEDLVFTYKLVTSEKLKISYFC